MKKNQYKKKNHSKTDHINNRQTDVNNTKDFYGNISPAEIYKSGGLYGVVSIKDF